MFLPELQFSRKELDFHLRGKGSKLIESTILPSPLLYALRP